MCGLYGPLSLHHRKKRSHLPKDERWNPSLCVLIHGSGTTGCHGWSEAHPKEAWEIGFHVRPWEDYREIPILLHGTHWVRLPEEMPGYDYLDDKEIP